MAEEMGLHVPQAQQQAAPIPQESGRRRSGRRRFGSAPAGMNLHTRWYTAGRGSVNSCLESRLLGVDQKRWLSMANVQTCGRTRSDVLESPEA